jgi:hypothetical protein
VANPLSGYGYSYGGDAPGSPGKARLLSIRFCTPITSPHGSCRSPRVSASGGGELGGASQHNSPRGSLPCSPLASSTFSGPSPYGRLLGAAHGRPPAPWADSPTDAELLGGGGGGAQRQQQQQQQLALESGGTSPAPPEALPATGEDECGGSSPRHQSGAASPPLSRRHSTSRLGAGSSRLSHSSMGRSSNSALGTPQGCSRGSSGGPTLEALQQAWDEAAAADAATGPPPSPAEQRSSSSSGARPEAPPRPAAAAASTDPPLPHCPANPSSRRQLLLTPEPAAAQQAEHEPPTWSWAGLAQVRGQGACAGDAHAQVMEQQQQQCWQQGPARQQVGQQQGEQRQGQGWAAPEGLLAQGEEEEVGCGGGERYPDIPEVTFIDMLGRGSYGNVYKGGRGSLAVPG